MLRPNPTPARRIWISLRLDRWVSGPLKRRPRKGGEAEREPVEPPRPRPLAGGAAAELEFDD